MHSASHAGPCKCDNECRAEGFKFFEIAAVVSEGGGAAHTMNLCKKCHNERRAKQGEAEVTASKVEGADRAEGFSRKVMGSSRGGTILALNVKKCGPDRSWKMQKS